MDTRADLELFRERFALQREVLVHVRSLDQEFGRNLPAVVTP